MTDDNRITNVDDVIERIEQYEHLLPHGDYQGTTVENPQLNDNVPPRYVRVRTHRKGSNYKLIREAHELGLRVADVWQYDEEREDHEVSMKLVPQPQRATRTLTFLEAFYHNAVEQDNYELAAQVHNTMSAIRNKYDIETNE